MASSKKYLEFMLDQLSELEDISYESEDSAVHLMAKTCQNMPIYDKKMS